MSKILLGTATIIALIGACQNTEPVPNTPQSAYGPIDTVKIAALDTLANQLSGMWKRDSTFHQLPAGTGPADSVEYIEVAGEPRRISATFYTDTSATWGTFYQVNNEMKLVRFRQWKGKYKPVVKEVFSYYENGKIFYTKERGRPLEQGEPISVFRDLTFFDNARPPAELEAEYMPFWEIAKKAIDKYKSPQNPQK
jgi:hypothetical protein